MDRFGLGFLKNQKDARDQAELATSHFNSNG